MSRKIGVCNFKGGVGKTVIAINLSSVLSQIPAKVLIVDLDRQLNAITGLGIAKKDILMQQIIKITNNLYITTNINLGTEDYAYIIYDVPPKDLNIMDMVIQLADTLLIPIVPDFFSLEGLAQIMHYIKEKSQIYNKNNINTLIITNQYQDNDVSLMLCKEIKQYFGDKLCFSVIPNDDNIKQSISFGKSVIEYNPLSASAISFILLSKEIQNGRGSIW